MISGIFSFKHKELAGLAAMVLGGIYYTIKSNRDQDTQSLGDIVKTSEIIEPGIMKVQGREIEGGKYANTVAESDFASGQILMSLDFSKCEQRTYQTLQLGQQTHAIEDFSSYFNHHCDPSVKIVLVTKHVDDLSIGSQIQALVVAIKDIRVGDEINFAYFTSEWDMTEKFKCRCSAPHCLGQISGASGMSEDQLKPYADQLLPHIKDMLAHRDAK